MSTSYNVSVIRGIPVAIESLQGEQKPDPLWGKVKYDPETGRKVEEFLPVEENSYASYQRLDDAAALEGLSTIFLCELDLCFVGKRLANVDANGFDSPALMEFEPEAVRAAIDNLMATLKLSYDPSDLRTYLVSHPS